jgi:hypothetical protein
MRNEWNSLNNFTNYELSLHEQMHIEAGGFWEIVGIICGVLTVVAIIYVLGGAAVLLAL